MNEFNNSVKQNSKVIFIVAIASIVALFLCLSVSFAFSHKTAIAEPDLQSTLDQASNAYFGALAAQEEAQAKVNEAEATIADCEEQIPYVQGKLNKRAKSMYVNRGFGEILELIIGATSIEDLINNIQYINFVNNKDAALVKSCKDLKAKIEFQKAELDANLAAATEQANIAADAYNAAQVAIAQAQAQAEAERGGGGGGGGGYTPTQPAEYLGDVVATARACIGYPYAWAQAGPYGFDCSGLVSWCYGGGGWHIFTTYTFMNEGSGFHRIAGSQAVPGDVVSTWEHCGIYIGGGMMIHAPTEGDVVKEAVVQGGMDFFTRR